MKDLERRITSGRPRLAPGRVTVRAGQVVAGPRLVGFAACYAVRGHPLGKGEPYVEVFARGCFDRTLSDGHIIKSIWNCNTDAILGSTGPGTLKLVKHQLGLVYNVILPETGIGRDIEVLVDRGDVRDSTVGFRPVDLDYDQKPDGTVVCTFLDVDLMFVGPTTFSAFDTGEAQIIRSRLARELRSPLASKYAKPPTAQQSQLVAGCRGEGAGFRRPGPFF